MGVREILQETGADALLVTDPYNMRYLSGFTGGEGILFMTENRNVLITDSRYTEAASRESSFEIIEENRSHRRLQILQECVLAEGVRALGYEDRSMRCSEFREFSSGLKDVQTWIPMEGRVDALRMIKSKEELELLRRAEEIGDQAFRELLKVIHVGMTELEAAAELEYYMKRFGANGFSFDTIMASGKHSSMPHAVPTEKKIGDGDFVTMDFGCIYKGYCSDMTRTIAFGKISREQKKIYDTVLKAQTEALSAIHAGMTGEEVDRVARDIIYAEGYEGCFGHALGHSVGLFIHEDPRLGPGSKTVLQPGMIETIEPGIYVPGFCGVRIEDMVCVTEDGCEDFAHSPKELIIL